MKKPIKLFLVNAKKSLTQYDKQQHFVVSFVIFSFLYLFTGLFAALVITLLIGFIKEIWDHYKGSGFCWWDMAANIVGIFVGYLLLLSMNYFIA